MATDFKKLVEDAVPAVRGDLNDKQWEKVLLEQNEDMVERLVGNRPLDIRRGVQRGVVVFSIYEKLISERTERGVKVDLSGDGEKELVGV